MAGLQPQARGAGASVSAIDMGAPRLPVKRHSRSIGQRRRGCLYSGDFLSSTMTLEACARWAGGAQKDIAMTTQPLMPKATAVWLVENTALSFDQIADFCKLHPLEV